jgi:hypothetical protein
MRAHSIGQHSTSGRSAITIPPEWIDEAQRDEAIAELIGVGDRRRIRRGVVVEQLAAAGHDLAEAGSQDRESVDLVELERGLRRATDDHQAHRAVGLTASFVRTELLVGGKHQAEHQQATEHHDVARRRAQAILGTGHPRGCSTCSPRLRAMATDG